MIREETWGGGRLNGRIFLTRRLRQEAILDPRGKASWAKSATSGRCAVCSTWQGLKQVGKAAGQQDRLESTGVDADELWHVAGDWVCICTGTWAHEHGHLVSHGDGSSGQKRRRSRCRRGSQHYRLHAGGGMSGGYGMAKCTPNRNWWLKWLPRCNTHVSICDMTRTTPRRAVAVRGELKMASCGCGYKRMQHGACVSVIGQRVGTATAALCFFFLAAGRSSIPTACSCFGKSIFPSASMLPAIAAQEKARERGGNGCRAFAVTGRPSRSEERFPRAV